MSKRIVRVTFSSDETVALRGKLADIVYWICRNAHRLDPIQQGELSINWTQDESGNVGSFRPTVRSTLPSQKFSA